MDSRLVLSVVFVTLCWGFMGTYAQSTTTTMPSTATSTMNNMTATMAGANNMTATMAGTNNMTTTMAGTNNMTTSTVSTTTAPPVSPNITVVLLETPVSRAECGTQQLCAAEPADCDPSVAGSCFFLGARQQNGQNFEFALSGQSEGYIAASLASGATPGANDPTYVCANNGGNVQFFGTVIQNGELVRRNLSVTSVRGRVVGNQIQCTFTATIPDPLIRTTSFSLSVSSGPFNATAGTLGAPTTVIRTPAVDLANPNVTVANEVNTTSAPTTPGTNTTQQATTSTAGATTTSALTTTGASTTTQATTQAPPVPLLSVGNLMINISRTGCGSQKLCVAEPSECDPSIADSCFFFSANQQSGQTFDFELSGQTTGYVAAALSTDTTVGNGNDIFYICGNVNGRVLFFGATLNNNNQLVDFAVNVSSVNGSVSNNQIQCVFRAAVPDTSTRAAGFSVTVATGTVSGTGAPGFPTIQIRTNVIDLTNPNATFINLQNANSTNSTATPATTGHAVTHQQSLIPALLFTLVVLLFTMQGGN